LGLGKSSLAIQSSKGSNDDVHLVNVLLLQQWPPKLQKQSGFVEAVSRLLGEGVLDGKLVSNEPKGPTLCCK
jgi:hypothetical protein